MDTLTNHRNCYEANRNVLIIFLSIFTIFQVFLFCKQSITQNLQEQHVSPQLTESTLIAVRKFALDTSNALSELKQLYGASHTLMVGEDDVPARTSIVDLVPEKYIYVYDFGLFTKNLTTDLEESPIRWWSTQYEGEYVVFDLLYKQGIARTYNPDEAVLFYVPFYSARYTLLNLGEDENMNSAVEKTSKVWEELLTRVKEEYPYFNRSNGRDHFSVLTMDHGRCTGITFCEPSIYGEMFFFQLNGDKMVRSNHASTSRRMQALTYNYGVKPADDLPDIPCYMSDRDIVLPPISTAMEIVKPDARERQIVALFRFTPGHHHGVPIPHFNHFLRKELLEMYEGKGIEGWDFAQKSEWDTRDDWKNSIFCIAPPGHSQWTSRPVKAIISGCIPVTFYRDHDNPWQDELSWDMFSINIDPDQLSSLPERINYVLKTPGKLREMQKTLESVQEYFIWGSDSKNGARVHIMKDLHKRAERLSSKTSVFR